MSPAVASLASLVGVDGFEHADRLPWLAVLAALACWATWRTRAHAERWVALPEARVAGARRLEATPILAWLLRGIALAALATAAAGPLTVREAPPESGRGLDLVLVLDTSASMRALDAVVDGRSETRLGLARSVVGRFARRRAAEGDRVGLVVFGDDAFTLCPLTRDAALLDAALARTDAGMAGDSTALGDALALATKRVLGAGDPVPRVVVLLTDGRSNTGAIPTELAAELAAAEGVRVHTVGIGSGGEEVPMAARAGTPRGGLRFERHDPDPATLRAIAAQTGGRFFEARRSGDLERVYAAIDALERAPRPLPPRRVERERSEPLLAAAGAALLLEIAWARGLRRRLP